MYSHQNNNTIQEADNKQVRKVEKIKEIRKSEGYQRFINKFKKYLNSS